MWIHSRVLYSSILQIKLKLIWKPPPRGVALIVEEDAMQAAKVEEHLVLLPSGKVYEP